MSDSLPEESFSGVIRVVKLTSGEEVIALVKEASSDKITFCFPARIEIYYTKDPNGELFECFKLTNYLSNIKGNEINIPKDVIVYSGSPTPNLEKMYETYFATMQTDPKVVITSGDLDKNIGPEAGLHLLNELFNNEDFVNFVNDLIDNFEGVEISMDLDDDEEEINTEDYEPETPTIEQVADEPPKPQKPRKRRIMNPESNKLPYDPNAPANKPESWSDNPTDYL